MWRCAVISNLLLTSAFTNRDLTRSVSDAGHGSAIVDPSGVVAVEKASLFQVGGEVVQDGENNFFEHADELLQGALDKKADKTELGQKITEATSVIESKILQQSETLKHEIEGKATEMTQKIDSSTADMSAKIDQVQTEKQQLDEKIGGVQTSLDETKSSFEGKIDGVQSSVSAAKEDLEKKITESEATSTQNLGATKQELEGKVAAVSSDLATVKTTLEARIQKVEVQIHEEDQKKFEAIDERFQDLQKDINDVELSLVKFAKDDAAARMAKIDALEVQNQERSKRQAARGTLKAKLGAVSALTDTRKSTSTVTSETSERMDSPAPAPPAEASEPADDASTASADEGSEEPASP